MGNEAPYLCFEEIVLFFQIFCGSAHERVALAESHPSLSKPLLRALNVTRVQLHATATILDQSHRETELDRVQGAPSDAIISREP